MNRMIQGDALETLKLLPTVSVHSCITSPPYWGLRDYETATWKGGDSECEHVKPSRQGKNGERATRTTGHDDFYRERCDKCGAHRIDQQLGLEATVEEYIAKMVEVFGEVRRVLRDDGTLWLNIGDKSTSGVSKEARNGLNTKNLFGIPWRLVLALQADEWYLRSEIIWHKPNPNPESARDRPTRAHDNLFLLSKKPRYYWDAEAVREPNAPGGKARIESSPGTGSGMSFGTGGKRYARLNSVGLEANGRNLRSVWTIPTQSFPAAHFATFPEKLVMPMIKAGTSERGCCSECGAPWKREVESRDTGRTQKMADGWDTGDGGHGTIHRDGREAGKTGVPVMERHTVGWHPTCKCVGRYGSDPREIDWYEPVPCTVLDPFAGAGTVGLVAAKLGRSSIGIELSPEYCAMARERIAGYAPLFTQGETDE